MRRQGERGFSILESLIAAAILLLIAIGVLPIFTRAMVNNVAGSESTTVTAFGRSDVEEAVQLAFSHLDLDVATGQIQRDLPKEYWLSGSGALLGDESWSSAPPGPLYPWERQTTIRDYSIEALDDSLLTEDEALDGGEDPGRVHFKTVTVTVNSGREAGSALGPGRRITLRAVKSH